MFSFFARLFNSFVLLSFLWTTLFSTIAFADIKPVIFEKQIDPQTCDYQRFAHFNLSIQKTDDLIDLEENNERFSLSNTLSQKETALSIPLGSTYIETQALIDRWSIDSIYEYLTLVEQGFTWTSYGLDFYLHNSGNLFVSKNTASVSTLQNIHLQNAHGAIILADDLSFNHLTLSAANVIQKGKLLTHNLSLKGQLSYLNQGFLTVSNLIFESGLMDENETPVLPEFKNENHILMTGSAEIKGDGLFFNNVSATLEAQNTLSLANTSFVNDGLSVVHEKTTLSLNQFFLNNGTAIFKGDVQIFGNFKLTNTSSSGNLPTDRTLELGQDEDVSGIAIKGNLIFDAFKGTIDNNGVFSTVKSVSGQLTKLNNFGIFGTSGGFDALIIDHLMNYEPGHILGDGSVTLHQSANRGVIKSSHLSLNITNDLDNTGKIDVSALTTKGQGSFYQKGILQSEKVAINNEHFENTGKIESNEALSFGNYVKTLINHDQATIHTHALTMDRENVESSRTKNDGYIKCDSFVNARTTFINTDTIHVKTWQQTQGSFVNEAGSSFTVDHVANITLAQLLNRGDMSFKGEKSLFTIDDLQNDSGATFVVAKLSTLNVLTVNNKGKISFYGITGSANRFENRETVSFLGTSNLTGDSFLNEKKMNMDADFSFDGQSFVTTESSIIRSKFKINLSTYKPLHLKGNIFAQAGAGFKAPSIVNEASVRIETGNTLVDGLLTNIGKMDLDQFFYIEQDFVNEGDFQINQFLSSGRFYQLTNTGCFLSRSGNAYFETLINSGTFATEKGSFKLNLLDNTNGTAVFDSLEFMGLNAYFDGNVRVKKLKGNYDDLYCQGDVTIESGNFSARNTINTSTLDIQSGSFSLGVLTNTLESKFYTKALTLSSDFSGPSIRDIINDGEIISTADLTLDSIKNLRKLGVMKVGGNLTLKSTYIDTDVDWMDEFLFAHKNNLHIRNKLIIETQRFLNRYNFTRPAGVLLDDLLPYDSLPYHVHFKVHEFINYAKLTTRGLTFDIHSFQNGQNNDCMGTIHSYGPIAGNVTSVFDNRFGFIEATADCWIKSQGEILNGWYVECDETIKVSFADYPVNPLMWHWSLSNHPFTEHRKIRNGARIISRGKITLESAKNITNDFGLIYGLYEDPNSETEVRNLACSNQEIGVTIKTPLTFSNKTGFISSGSHIQIDARKLENSIGTEHLREYIYHENKELVYGMRDVRTVPWHQIYRTWYESDSAHIQTPNGNIYLNIFEGMNKGSYLLSPFGVYINGNKFKEGDSIPSHFSHEKVATYNTFYEHVHKGTSGPLADYHFDEISHGAFQSGRVIDAQIGIFTLSGNINSLNVSINAHHFQGISSFTRRHATGNYSLDLGGLAQSRLGNNSLFNRDDQGTLQINILGSENVPRFNPRSAFSLTPLASDIYDLSPRTLEFTLLYALSDFFGTLNIFNKSGRDLLNEFHRRGKHIERLMIDQGHQFSDSLVTRNTIESFDEALIYYRAQNDVQRPYLYIPERLIVRTALEAASSITGNRVNINVGTGGMTLDGTVFESTAPYNPEEDTIRLKPVAVSTERSTFQEESLGEDFLPSIPVTVTNTRQRSDDIRTSNDDEDEASKLLDTLPIGSMNIQCDGPVNAKSTQFFSHDTINLHIKGNASFESTTETMHTSNGWQHIKRPVVFNAKKEITLTTRENLLLRAIEATSDTSILFQATGNIFDLDLALAWSRNTIEYNNDGLVIVKEQGKHANTSTYTTSEGVTFKSGGTIESCAPTIRAKTAYFIAQKGVTIHDVCDMFARETQQHVEGKGMFGKEKEIFTMYQSMHSKGANFGDTKTEITLGECGKVEMTNVSISDLTIDTKGGVIRFNLGKNVEHFQRMEKASNAFWQSQSMHQAKHETGSQSTIGNLNVISAEEIIIESVRGQTAEFLKRIEMDGGKITELFWDEVHEVINKKVSGPTAACAVLIAIAVSAVTCGTGAAQAVGGMLATSMGAATGLTAVCAGTCMAGVGTTMFAAGFTSLCTSAVMSLAHNDGDIGKAAKRFASKDTFNSLGMSMLTAGVTHGMMQQIGLPTDISQITEFTDHIKNQGINAAVKVGADLASTGKVDAVAVTLGAVAGTLGSYMSNKIGNWYSNATSSAENAVLHKVLHGLKGAGEGMIVGGEKGIAAGALGAMVAETTADFMTPTGGINRMDVKDRPQYDADQIRMTQSIARLVTGMVAFSAGMSADQIGVAMLAANTSLEHNFAYTALNHSGVKTEVKDEIIDESSLKADAEANGVSPEEQVLVRTKLQNLSIENLGNAPKATELITQIPSSPEALEATQNSLVKNCVQKIAAANENLHQILREHPWAEKTLSSSVRLFGNCMRAMLYIDMAVLGAAGGTGLCAASGIKNIAGLRTCALLGGATSVAATAFSLEPSIEAVISEGVKQLSSVTERFGDTPQEKADIRQLVGDTVDVAGMLAGIKYLQYRAGNLPSFGDRINGGVVDAEMAGAQTSNNILQNVENPGRIQSRINLRSGEGTNKAPGLENAWRKHGSDAVDTKSKFTISKDELKMILSDSKVVQSQVKLDQRSGSFVREVDIGKEIGNISIKDGGCPTTKITILADEYGNLINVYPGSFFTKR